MESNWITYPLEMAEDKPGLCTVDLGWADEPDADRPYCLAARVALPDAGPDGFGTPEQREAMAHIEDALEEKLSTSCDAALVAIVRGCGNADFWFYLAHSHTEQAEHLIKQAFAAYKVEVNVVNDPEWEAYHENLLPDNEQLRTARDIEVMSQLEEAGDDATKPRPIEYTAYFGDAQTRDKYVARAQQNKFTLVEKTSFEHEGETVHVARLQRTSRIDHDEIAEASGFLDELAESLGGEYDGWESPVVK